VRKQSIYATLTVIFLAVPVGSALYTFSYAEGASYLSADPNACANCHIMRETFDDWNRGEHAHVATCNDCHVPHNFVGKWLTKAENGWNHSLAMTLGSVPSNITARAASRQVAIDNCMHCHAPLLGDTQHGGSGGAEELDCLNCHRSIGHPH
jgi:cytochrome c nitrite reductase small subunit